MRCRIGPKKLKRLRRDFGPLVDGEIVAALTRGNTGHRLDLCLSDGRIVCYDPNSGEAWLSSAKYGLGTKTYEVPA